MSTGLFMPFWAHFIVDQNPVSGYPIYATIDRIEQYAGASIGSCVVRYGNRPDNPVKTIGSKCIVQQGARILFRGVVIQEPIQVSENDDEIQVVCADDKFLLKGRTVGEIGVGTLGTPAGAEGFPDVGFEIVFNRDGRPNKHPTELQFQTGSSAVYWTTREVLQWLFAWYVPATVAVLDAGQLSGAYWSSNPTHLCLVGQTVLQAIETVATLAGESWGLIPDPDATQLAAPSKYVAVVPGNGTVVGVSVLKPATGSTVLQAGQFHPSSYRVDHSVENCFDKFQAVSAPIVLEKTYSIDNGLLTKLSYSNPEYQTRFGVDVTKYQVNGLGANLSAGSPPKHWLPRLVTRLNSTYSDYLTKAEIDDDPLKLKNEGAEIPVWISLNGLETDARLVLGGIRIDTEHCTIDLKQTIEVQMNSPLSYGDQKKGIQLRVSLIDWSVSKMWITVSTVLEIPESVTSLDANRYLSSQQLQRIEKNDLVPQWRHDAWLPILTPFGPSLGIITFASGDDVEHYIDVHPFLQEVVDAARQQSPELEVNIEMTFELFPLVSIGGLIAIIGRNIGTTGNEVVTAVTYNVHHQYATTVRASNVMTSVDPDKFIRGKKK